MTTDTRHSSSTELAIRLSTAYAGAFQALAAIPFDTARHLNAAASRAVPGAKPSLLSSASFERKLARTEALMLGGLARQA